MKILFSVFAALFLFVGCSTVGAVMEGGKTMATNTVDTVIGTAGNVSTAALRDVSDVVSTAADVAEGVVGTVVEEVDRQTDELQPPKEGE